ncbi:MAG: EamA family transporter [Rhodospirillales bacterium]|nr:EamA family transporter [Rhodospirillales bacterium]
MNQTRPLLGMVLAIISAVSFAAGSSAAVISYQAGASPLSVITTRIMFTIFALWLFIHLTGGKTSLGRRDRNISLALGLILGIQSYTLYEAIKLLPVALAILTFYLYPLLIALSVHFMGRERISPMLALSLAGAFVGLALALDVGGGGLNMLGIILAATSAAAFTIVAVTTQPVIARTGDSRPVNLHMHCSALTAFVAIDLAVGEYALPSGPVGWAAFAAVPFLYAIATTSFFIALGLIGPVRASLIMNLEPVMSIVFGFVLLGQVLTPLQLGGAAIVIAAVVAVKLDGIRKPVKN